MTNQEFNELFRKRTKAFAVRVIRFVETLPPTAGTRVIVFQLCKSATSVGANFRAFCRGRSTKEQFSKICIVVEEADETQYWLEVIFDAAYSNSDELKWLLAESLEILKVTAKIKSSCES